MRSNFYPRFTSSGPNNIALVDGLDACNTTTDPNRQVLEDYTRRLDEADAASAALTTASVEALATMPTGSLSLEFVVRHFVQSAAPIVVFNPSMHTRTELVRVQFAQPPVGSLAAPDAAAVLIPSVYRLESDATAKTAVTAQVEVNDQHTSQLTSSHHALPVLATALYFRATVSALGTARFIIEFDPAGSNSTTTHAPEVVVGVAAVAHEGLGFPGDPDCYRASFDARDGLLSSMSMRHDRLGCRAGSELTATSSNTTMVAVRQTFWQYVDANGGAYCLIEQTRAVELPPPFRVALTRGPLFQEVVQSFSFGNGLLQRLRLLAPPTVTAHPPARAASGNTRMLEVFHYAGRLPGNRELISRLTTDLCNGGLLFSEASGMSEFYPRPLNVTASIGQNYHAIVQTAAIRDNAGCGVQRTARELAVLTRRTMGVASLGEGELEYMWMRRITGGSDNQGPWPLNDKHPSEDQIRLMLGRAADVEAARFPAALAFEHPFTVFYASGGGPKLPKGGRVAAAAEVEAAQGLPDVVWAELLVRIDAAPNASYVLRLQNTVAGGQAVELPSLQAALGLPGMHACLETTLTMQQTRAANEASRLHWRADPALSAQRSSGDGRQGAYHGAAAMSTCKDAVLLDSLDIRTFTFGVGS